LASSISSPDLFALGKRRTSGRSPSVFFVGIMMIVAGIAEINQCLPAQRLEQFSDLGPTRRPSTSSPAFVTFENPLLAAAVLTLVLGAGPGRFRPGAGYSSPSAMKARKPVDYGSCCSSLVTMLLGLLILARWPVLGGPSTCSAYSWGVEPNHGRRWTWIGLGLSLRRGKRAVLPAHARAGV